MGWAVGEDRQRRRHIGYGVPATCDHPGCGVAIDRGLSFACGGGVTDDDPAGNCGLFFCGEHLEYIVGRVHAVCERCAAREAPFDATPDVPEWARHVLRDESWEQWRSEEPSWVEEMRGIAAAGTRKEEKP